MTRTPTNVRECANRVTTVVVRPESAKQYHYRCFGSRSFGTSMAESCAACNAHGVYIHCAGSKRTMGRRPCMVLLSVLALPIL